MTLIFLLGTLIKLYIGWLQARFNQINIVSKISDVYYISSLINWLWATLILL